MENSILLRAVERLFFVLHLRFAYLGLSEKQEAAMRVLRDTDTTELLYGGAANGGKSWLGCTWLIECCRHYPGTRWFIAREQLKDIRGSTFETFQKVCKKMGIDRSEWKYNGQDNYILFANGSRIDFLDCKFLPAQDPMFERLGSYEYTGGWIEEGGQLVEQAYEILRTRIGRNRNDEYGIIRKLLITCNPKRNWMFNYFIKPLREGTLPDNMKFVEAKIDDNTFRESGSKEQLEAIKSIAHRRRLLMGDWDYEDDPGMLVDYDAVSDLFTNSHVKDAHIQGKYITCDVARFGADKTRIGVWIGSHLVEIVTLVKQPTTATAAAIKAVESKYGIRRSCVAVDDDGVGGGVADQLPGCFSFVNNARPVDRPGDNSANLKSQCGFEIADRINEGSIFVTCSHEDKQVLIDDLLQSLRQKDVSDDGKRRLVEKAEVKLALGRSPDIADMIIMRGYFFLKPNVKSTMKSRAL